MCIPSIPSENIQVLMRNLIMIAPYPIVNSALHGDNAVVFVNHHGRCLAVEYIDDPEFKLPRCGSAIAKVIVGPFTHPIFRKE